MLILFLPQVFLFLSCINIWPKTPWEQGVGESSDAEECVVCRNTRRKPRIPVHLLVQVCLADTLTLFTPAPEVCDFKEIPKFKIETPPEKEPVDLTLSNS